jgi:hypothetical protein
MGLLVLSVTPLVVQLQLLAAVNRCPNRIWQPCVQSFATQQQSRPANNIRRDAAAAAPITTN